MGHDRESSHEILGGNGFDFARPGRSWSVVAMSRWALRVRKMCFSFAVFSFAVFSVAVFNFAVFSFAVFSFAVFLRHNLEAFFL